jgi:hypothetical protein
LAPIVNFKGRTNTPESNLESTSDDDFENIGE